jgi:DNA-binding NtrC family response regulator
MPTLLVVDDEPSILNFVGKAMVRRGWSVVEVDSVKAGLAVAQEQPIDVALCDVVMPEASGPEFARQLRARTSSVPIVLMTGHPTAPIFSRECLPRWWNPLPVLEKPFTLRELESVLSTALESKDTTSAAARS